MSTVKTSLTLDTPISALAGVGPAYVKRLEKLGIDSVRDLIWHLPRRYDDFSRMPRIREAKIGEAVSIKGELLQIQAKRSPRKRMSITEAVVSDETGAVKATWFNQPYLARSLKAGDEIVLSGKLEYRFGELQMTSPEFEQVKGEQTHTAGIIPVYGETEGVSSKWLRAKVKPLLSLTAKLPDPLPAELRERRNLLPLGEALRSVHFPPSQTAAEEARRRLSFDQLLVYQLLAQRIKLENQRTTAPVIPFSRERALEFTASLPFELTPAQKRAAWEVLQDLERSLPMNRLIEGDVGSGKTVVAAMALHHTATAGYQGAIMAPTEILAVQHFDRLRALLEPLHQKVGLLTSGAAALGGEKATRAELLGHLASGDLDVLVGTHALIQDDVLFHRLALAVVDEQHRFGVEQRARLRAENDGVAPHLLSMTATPIPRTLTLTVYGDLDLSVIDQLPPGRTPVETRRVMPQERTAAYEFIRGKVREGRQVFVICPLIDESDKLGVRSATAEHERLSKGVFPEFQVGLLHGRLPAKEKTRVMDEFAAGKTHILVATSVIEVGLDVPNATVMVIEGAERFGLSQLHQMRGRVGRGSEQSHCLLFSDSDSDDARSRLEAVVGSQSGFELAEADLKLRGPGEIYGKRQSGLPELPVATLLDVALIKEAREEAEALLGSDPDLKKHPELRARLSEVAAATHLE
jgi:ATP-dependent DNA helicase RecG